MIDGAILGTTLVLSILVSIAVYFHLERTAMNDTPRILEYRKTATIRAIQYTEATIDACRQFAGDKLIETTNPGQAIVQTLEGPLAIHYGDWLAQGVEEEFWPIAQSVFAKSYVRDA